MEDKAKNQCWSDEEHITHADRRHYPQALSQFDFLSLSLSSPYLYSGGNELQGADLVLYFAVLSALILRNLHKVEMFLL